MSPKCPIDRLPDEILQHILDLSMLRDSPFYLDNKYPKKRYPVSPDHQYPVLESADGARDARCTPQHPFSRRADHQRDWLAANATCRRFRRLGRAVFFRAKLVAMTTAFPDAAGLAQSRTALAGARMPIQNPADRAAALACIRHVVLVDARRMSPAWYLKLRRLLGRDPDPDVDRPFPQLRRCTLLFGFDYIWRGSAGHDPEWITAACALARPVPAEMRELLVGVGIPPRVEFEEALGPGKVTWRDIRADLEKYIYPTLRIKAKARLARKEKERAS
ncbi:hypothetical protein PG993_010857 [Apiospora rasikravindrae]|uniref:F-box domain-containing protein n=1 Tax=Apiospora rasikravindrae TaxID=990691 RepID=A0ABR1SCW0_9PEZI